jgi:hypothetical protein
MGIIRSDHGSPISRGRFRLRGSVSMSRVCTSDSLLAPIDQIGRSSKVGPMRITSGVYFKMPNLCDFAALDLPGLCLTVRQFGVCILRLG